MYTGSSSRVTMRHSCANHETGAGGSGSVPAPARPHAAAYASASGDGRQPSMPAPAIDSALRSRLTTAPSASTSRSVHMKSSERLAA